MAELKNRSPALTDYCQYLKGVGPSRALKLEKLGIENVEDLLTHYPRKYYDRRNIRGIGTLLLGEEQTVLGRIVTSVGGATRRGRARVNAVVQDDTGTVQVVWFNQPYLKKILVPGRLAVLSGSLRLYRGGRQIVNPEFELVGDELDQALLSGGRIVPVYPLTSGLSQRFLRGVISRTLDSHANALGETLPRELVEEMRLPSRLAALRAVHFPEDPGDHERARERLKLEELFYVQLAFSLQRRRRGDFPARPTIDGGSSVVRAFREGLDFELTAGQRRALEDFSSDFARPTGMNRLLQGDVGSGKTVVAACALLAAAGSGLQAAMMVPTEILAAQHHRTLSGQFERMGISSELLIGSLPAREKRGIHRKITGGGVRVVIGTHALIQSEVRFKNLGLVVIDEQHRFGVRQRAAMMRSNPPPHMLVMTATPIPRSLALTAYADLDVSIIDDMPSSRSPVKTRVVAPPKRGAMYRFIADQAHRGHRSYLLYPVIDETEKQDLEAATVAHESLSQGPLKGVGVGLLHGRMRAAEKEEAMKSFASGESAVLVATTVVEVGVHVPEATIMAVHHPERFGLSQLHQLRGRVGRGGEAGYCFLVAGDGLAPESRERLDVLVHEADGFRIAEEDLRIRGPGEFLGVRQHGVPGFKLANPLSDAALVECANRAVLRLLESDPGLSSGIGRRCRRHLKAIVSGDVALHSVV